MPEYILRCLCPRIVSESYLNESRSTEFYSVLRQEETEHSFLAANYSAAMVFVEKHKKQRESFDGRRFFPKPIVLFRVVKKW